MFILDDILLSPYKGMKWLFKEIQRQAQDELDGEAERITTELTDLYRRLENSEITEQEFEEREMVLLDRLDELQEDSNLLNEDNEYDQEYEDDNEEYEDDIEEYEDDNEEYEDDNEEYEDNDE